MLTASDARAMMAIRAANREAFIFGRG
jgi:hypothetical protein